MTDKPLGPEDFKPLELANEEHRKFIVNAVALRVLDYLRVPLSLEDGENEDRLNAVHALIHDAATSSLSGLAQMRVNLPERGVIMYARGPE